MAADKPICFCSLRETDPIATSAAASSLPQTALTLHRFLHHLYTRLALLPAHMGMKCNVAAHTVHNTAQALLMMASGRGLRYLHMNDGDQARLAEGVLRREIFILRVYLMLRALLGNQHPLADRTEWQTKVLVLGLRSRKAQTASDGWLLAETPTSRCARPNFCSRFRETLVCYFSIF